MYTRVKRKQNKPKEKWPIVILFDDREKKGIWSIDHPKYEFRKKRLKVADYSIAGFEDVIAVERKSGFQEFIGNFTGKKKAKFLKYLAKLAEYPLPVIVIEENLKRVPRTFNRLKYSGLKPEHIYSWMCKIVADFGIPIILMDCLPSERESFLYHLFEQLHDKAKKLGA